MRLTKLLGLMALALLAFGAVGTTIASAVEAEEEGKPQVLCFAANCITALEVPTTGEKKVSSLETLGGLILEGTEVTSTLSGIEALTGSTKDGGLAKDVKILFIGVHKGEQKCSTEGVKEPGEVEALLDLHVSAGLNASKVLVPLLLAKVLNKALTAELTIKCGVVKDIVKGTIGCAISPGLTAIPTTALVEIKCALNKTTHDQSTGITCNVLCTENEKDPFEAKLGEKFEDAGMEITLKGKPNKEIYIDD